MHILQTRAPEEGAVLAERELFEWGEGGSMEWNGGGGREDLVDSAAVFGFLSSLASGILWNTSSYLIHIVIKVWEQHFK